VDRATLLTLSRDDLIALIEAQAGQIARLVEAHAQQIATLTARIADLEAKLALPPKNPDNSSLPPSKGEKPNLPDRGKKPRPSRPGVARSLAENPDRIIEATLDASLRCLSNGCAVGTFGSYARIATMRLLRPTSLTSTPMIISTCRRSAPSSPAFIATAGPAPAAARPSPPPHQPGSNPVRRSARELGR
jgi:transposase